MAKYFYEQRMKAVLVVTEKHMSYEVVGKQLGYCKTHVIRWVKRYERFGADGLTLKRGTYTGEFKQNVVEYIYKNHLSIFETATIFEIPTDVILRERTSGALQERPGWFEKYVI